MEAREGSLSRGVVVAIIVLLFLLSLSLLQVQPSTALPLAYSSGCRGGRSRLLPSLSELDIFGRIYPEPDILACKSTFARCSKHVEPV